MGKSYHTTSSSLFTNDNKAQIPDWMSHLDSLKIEKTEQLDIPFEKKAAFNTSLKVSRDGRDYNSREVVNTFSNERLITAAKIELAKFLSGKYYTVEANGGNDEVELKARITNVPATFSFRYVNKKGRVASLNTFTIDMNGEPSEEYPFSKAGLEECIEDIKEGRVKTGEKAVAYKAYTITLDEILRRFNGDQRAAMDKIRELVASEDIIGVETNTFATVYAIDSLFPQLKKEGNIEEAPSFEFVKNKEHVAANPKSSGTKLMVEASKVLHNFFDDFHISSSKRDGDDLLVKATVNNGDINQVVDFVFGIEEDKVASVKYCEKDDKKMTVEQLLNGMDKTNLLTAYLNQEKRADKARIYRGRVLTSAGIHKALMRIASRDIIAKVIENWKERGLITPVASNTFTTEHSLVDLLNSVNAELLTEEERANLSEYMKRVTANMNRIDQKDMGVRNDSELVYSKSIRLANLYNRVANLLDNFKFVSTNDDCTKTVIKNYSPEGEDELTLTAKFEGNKCVKATLNAKKDISKALAEYKKNHANRKNVFANAVFSKKMVVQAIDGIFKEANKAADFITANYADDLGNGFYAARKPLSAIINELGKSNKFALMDEEDKKELLAAKAYFGTKLNADYVNDTGVRDGNIEYSKSIRLANTYHSLSKKFASFKITSVNDDATEVGLEVQLPENKVAYRVSIDYDGNSPDEIICKTNDKLHETEAVKCYKNEHGKLHAHKAVFSKKMVRNALKSSVASEDIESAVDKICELAEDIGNDYFASDMPLVYLINNCDLPFTNSYEEQATFGTPLEREDVEDTGVRDKTEIKENVIRLINKASEFLAGYFGDFDICSTSFNEDDNSLAYTIKLFDENSGLTNTITFDLSFDNGRVKECTAKLGDTKVSIDNVYKAFDSNEILNKYLKYHAGKKVNAPVVISVDNLVKKLNDITSATEGEIKKAILSWYDSHKLKRISSNTFASSYTVEQLLSTSNLKALDDEEITAKLKKAVRNKELKLRASYLKDNDNRPLVNEWDEEKFTRFARSEINKKYRNAEITDVSLTDDKFIVTARVDDNGFRKSSTFTWKLEDGRPYKFINSKSEATSSVADKYAKKHKSTASNIIISKAQLKDKLLGYIDVDMIDHFCHRLVENGAFEKIGENKFASKYTVAEILNAFTNAKVMNKEKIQNQVALANRKNGEEFDTTPYELNDASRSVPHKERLNDNDLEICAKLKKNIKLANDNKLITNRKANYLLEALDNVKSHVEIENVYKEFKKFL